MPKEGPHCCNQCSESVANENDLKSHPDSASISGIRSIGDDQLREKCSEPERNFQESVFSQIKEEFESENDDSRDGEDKSDKAREIGNYDSKKKEVSASKNREEANCVSNIENDNSREIERGGSWRKCDDDSRDGENKNNESRSFGIDGSRNIKDESDCLGNIRNEDNRENANCDSRDDVGKSHEPGETDRQKDRKNEGGSLRNTWNDDSRDNGNEDSSNSRHCSIKIKAKPAFEFIKCETFTDDDTTANDEPRYAGDTLNACTSSLVNAQRETKKPRTNQSSSTKSAKNPAPSAREKPFVCNQCSTSFTAKSSLRRHTLLHTGEKLFTCSDCSASFAHKGNLKSHIRCLHTQEKPFSCSICSATFKRKRNLAGHMSVHKELKSFSCDQCSASFSRVSDLKRHVLVHSGGRNFRCPRCPWAFTSERKLKAHMSSDHGEKLFRCSLCSGSFSQRFHLEVHMLTHSGEKPFTCSQCSVSFRHRGNLRRHLLIHSGVKSFDCDQCAKSFSQKGNLKKHLLSHLNNAGPFKCQYCTAVFKRMSFLQSHELNHSLVNSHS